MELKKGMYVRFNGFISKIGHINTSKKGNIYVQFKQPNGLLAHTRIENIEHASFNLIDLIEEGDYVNGLLVMFNTIEMGGNVVLVSGGGCFSEEEIEDIVTKEQFDSLKYVVERDK